MNFAIFEFLKNYSNTPFIVDRLIVSAFLSINKRIVKQNDLLLEHIITQHQPLEYDKLKQFEDLIKPEVVNFDFEHLIELFEFVVSPADKVINGAVYTPIYIREFILSQLFSKTSKPVSDLYCVDLSCGCGGFLMNISSIIHEKTGRNFSEIFSSNIYGLDITGYSIVRAKLLLSLFALFKGEDTTFKFNLEVGNALSYNWLDNFSAIRSNGGFDLIAGNPPYVASRNMDKTSLELMQNWSVTKTGHPDLYIPFFQIGLEHLASNGKIGFITVNTFTKSINGRALRKYFSTNKIGLRIINFGGEQVFKGRNTYTCLCFIDKINNQVEYIRTHSSLLSNITTDQFYPFKYSELNDEDGWNLVNTRQIDIFIRSVEETGKPFKDLYTTKNGIATLKNEVYKFIPNNSDQEFFYLFDNRQLFPIERSICRDIINANKIKTETDIFDNIEKIIFPYYSDNGKIKIIPEDELEAVFPMAYKYLLTKRTILATRDKGRGKYEAWYAYGRRQSMDINAFKLFFPHICERPTFVLSENKELLFYNGIAVISNNVDELLCLKKILSSDIFFRYIQTTSKDYASGYISMSKNYLKNFGVYQMNDEERLKLINSFDTDELLHNWYNI